jgi:hypothetical protein
MQYAPPVPGVQAPAQTRTIKMVSANEGKPFTDVQFIFGEMVRLAAPVLQQYRSDLYHDALWLYRHMNDFQAGERDTCHWYLGASHTYLSKEPLSPQYVVSRHDQHYLFTVYQSDRGWWCLDITHINPEGV